MVMLTRDRNTPRASGDVYEFPVDQNQKIFAGALVMMTAGFVQRGSTGLNFRALGRAEETVDNTGGAAGAKTIKVRAGEYQFANSAGADEVNNWDVGTDCYIVDDQTVAKTNGTNSRSRAGRVTHVDAQGVWVAVGAIYP